MNVLQAIEHELQHIIDAISAITEIDLTIVDDRRNRVAATGQIRKQFLREAPQNSAFQKSLETGQQYLITDAKHDLLCLGCVNRADCNELAELCMPIRYRGEIIGVLGMSAFSEKARDNLIQNKDSYMHFEHQLGKIIETLLRERDYGALLEYRSRELFTLINALDQGVVILDAELAIVTVNQRVRDKLRGADLQHFRDVLPENVIETLKGISFDGEIGPVKLKKGSYLIRANRIQTPGSARGYILIFTNFDKMKQSVIASDLQKHMPGFDQIIGESEQLMRAKMQAMQVAGRDAAVILIGETGTGKEVFAKAIHTASRRSQEVFLTINSGAIPENLIESELFGYEGGAFTGASAKGRSGRFELAKEGTLFLDEIGDLPFPMQVKLLRAIEEKEITRVGGHSPIAVSPRIISATHRDLARMVAEGSFREDLFYRLNVVPIVIPPLRERGYDILLLARHFLDQFRQIHNKQLSGFTPECERLLMAYHYPGNIRELRNLIEYAVIFEQGERVGAEHIQDKLEQRTPKHGTLLAQTRIFEQETIRKALDRYPDDLAGKQQAAKELGISIATLYRKLSSDAPAEK